MTLAPGILSLSLETQTEAALWVPAAAHEWVHWGQGGGMSLLRGWVLDNLSLWSWRMYTCHTHTQMVAS